jgi:cation diffusion facilitator family transporter
MSKSGESKIIPDYGDINDPNIRAKYGYLEATISIIGNIIIFFIKLLLGIFINSIALIADGVHSLSDVSTSGVVIFGFRIAKKKPDKEHPYGHGRVEYIATLLIAILLILVGVGFIQQSIDRIINLETIQHGEYAIIISIIVIISAILKELMARYSNAIAKKIKSDVIKADAWHHRSDAFSSIGVAIGIIAARYGFPILDPIFGILVSVIIIFVGINLVRNASDFLIGQSPDHKLIEQIKEIAQETGNVMGIHDVSIHDYGTTKILTIHAEVDSNLPLKEAHKIADNLEKNIHIKTSYSTIIHLDPKEMQNKLRTKKRIIETILNKHKEIVTFHKIQIIRGVDNEEIKMHLIVDKDMSVKNSHELGHRLKSSLEEVYSSCNVDIHFEPCGKDCKMCTIPCQKRIDSIDKYDD